MLIRLIKVLSLKNLAGYAESTSMSEPASSSSPVVPPLAPSPSHEPCERLRPSQCRIVNLDAETSLERSYGLESSLSRAGTLDTFAPMPPRALIDAKLAQGVITVEEHARLTTMQARASSLTREVVTSLQASPEHVLRTEFGRVCIAVHSHKTQYTSSSNSPGRRGYGGGIDCDDDGAGSDVLITGSPSKSAASPVRPKGTRGEKYTVYFMSVEYGVRSWTLKRRYSEFHALYKQIGRDPALASHLKRTPFPAKTLFGSLSDQEKLQRRAGLSAFMQAAVEATAELTLSGMHALSSFIEFQDRFCPQLGEPNEAEKQLQFAFESIELY